MAKQLYWKILTLKKRIIGCKFTTRATVLDNRRSTDNRGTTKEWYRGGIQGYFESFEEFRHGLWEGMVNFINGKTCRVSFHLSALYLKMDVIRFCLHRFNNVKYHRGSSTSRIFEGMLTHNNSTDIFFHSKQNTAYIWHTRAYLLADSSCMKGIN
ncbi:hypothetical protein HanRHA438_Chr11g0503421 [Helianthus annuus]|uniref:Uncharacterized protein n=1 Tax=Helianthus annuus TaxID=4232 RepID=A0A251TE66_HELAN|nr:uncharacterized protein LOC118483808 isoform X2 [Helianthus annuus]XP_035835324.1 uncharacterized protein LOC118483808 isoform X2 [Helianthus annuus]KAF5782024.1 hypothetical protein HanXRQr2_Chr11g0490641 [Helianthus annuus]KAJ0501567.1 hypothetical protein HanHA300_Chr11g0402191 [Helianthus annuus]KAJ0509391.1 hypothetical protein HanIR_Chr11g0528251 [Helianthus annuus]KAJ0517474.1 hypothetical protein HanHA89_Chr11g0425701 [Helianthus annuus]KAJ0685484.1 hypothetical protein HanLR1_Chr1